MSDYSESIQPAPSEAASVALAGAEYHARERAHTANVRFHLLVNAGFAAVGTLILKMDGPYYADAIVAGLFACGFGLSIFALRSTRSTETAMIAAEERKRSLEGSAPNAEEHAPPAHRASSAIVFILLATFFLSAAVATIWFSYVALRDQTVTEEDAVARMIIDPREAC